MLRWTTCFFLFLPQVARPGRMTSLRGLLCLSAALAVGCPSSSDDGAEGAGIGAACDADAGCDSGFCVLDRANTGFPADTCAPQDCDDVGEACGNGRVCYGNGLGSASPDECARSCDLPHGRGAVCSSFREGANCEGFRGIAICAADLVCASRGDGETFGDGVCLPPANRALDDNCTADAECAAGLECGPEQQCVAEFDPGADGTACTDDGDCTGGNCVACVVDHDPPCPVSGFTLGVCRPE